MNRPSIVWIFLDQLRADVLGCYGHPFVATPNLDRLAASGVLFERAYCQNPICVPSRVSMLSGMYGFQTGVYNNDQAMRPADSLLLNAFLGAGYRTANVGKVHLGITPQAAGFQEHRGITHDGTPHMRVPDRYPPDLPWGRFDADGFPKPIIYATDLCPRDRTYCAVGVDHALDLFARHGAAADPFLLRLSLDRPHTPVSSPPPYDTLYRDRTPVPVVSETETDGQPPFLAAYRRDRRWDRFTADQIHKIRHYYYGLVTHLDAELGRLLDAVRDSPRASNTLVVLTVDHGCMLGEHGLYVKGPHYYEPTARVPFLLAWPGRLPAGRRVAGLVEMVDLLPTLCELCAVPVPARAAGRSLLPLIEGRAPGRSEVLAEQKIDRADFVALRTDRYAYWRYRDHGCAMLFDMQRDPDQRRNLMTASPPADVVRDLEARLAARMR